MSTKLTSAEIINGWAIDPDSGERIRVSKRAPKKQTLFAAALDAPQFIVDHEKIGNVAVDVTKTEGFPTQVCLNITYNNAPRTWLSPEDARGLAEMLLAAADVAEANG